MIEFSAMVVNSGIQKKKKAKHFKQRYFDDDYMIKKT